MHVNDEVHYHLLSELHRLLDRPFAQTSTYKDLPRLCNALTITDARRSVPRSLALSDDNHTATTTQTTTATGSAAATVPIRPVLSLYNRANVLLAIEKDLSSHEQVRRILVTLVRELDGAAAAEHVDSE